MFNFLGKCNVTRLPLCFTENFVIKEILPLENDLFGGLGKIISFLPEEEVVFPQSKLAVFNS